jgi:hypothetical protein
MPAGDGTGPAGMGPMTGWGMGYCGGYDAPGWAYPGFGRGRGYGGRMGRGGGGWGWRHQFYATGLPRWARWGARPIAAYGGPYAAPSRENEIEMLKGEAEWLKEQLDAIAQRMEDLGKE